jgi:hypothetical protein
MSPFILLAKMFGVSVATIERAAQITQAVHVLMDNCGPDVKRMLLSVDCRMGKGNLIALAGLSPERQREEIEGLRQRGHMGRSWRTQGEPVSMSVPVEPAAMAETIVRRRGREQAQRVYEELGRILHRPQVEPDSPREGGSSGAAGGSQEGTGKGERAAGVEE